MKKKMTNGKKKMIRENISLFLMCVPGLISVILFNYLPMSGIVMAFKNYAPRKGIWGSDWVGFDNFKFFFTSQDAFRTIRNTVLYSIDFLVVDLIVGVGVALLLYHLRKGIHLKIYHTIILIPRFISIIIIAYMSYAILSPSYGVLNKVIRLFGGEGVMWYSEPQYWPVILTIVHIWQIAGSGCLYYYAALVGIDESLFEAASLDGATTLQKCRYIMIPSLVPIVAISLILGVGHIFSGDMGLFYQIPRDQGMLYSTTDIINTYTYRALLTGNMSKSAAVSLFQSITGLVLVVATNAIIRKISPENSMF